MAPFLLGLIVGLAALIYKFVLKLLEFITDLHAAVPTEVIVGILNLVDLTLVANLIVIVVCSSYENFLAPIDPAKHPDIRKDLSGSASLASSKSCSALSWPLPQ